MKWTKVTPHGTLTFESFPVCPECGAPWENDHRNGGHCPGRPEGCTCQHEIAIHREPLGCYSPRYEGSCPCLYGKRPVNWATHDGDYSRKWEER